jgi:hypothetical protein
MIDFNSVGATISATMSSQIGAVSCRTLPRPHSVNGISRALYFTHNAGVAGSSPAPAIAKPVGAHKLQRASCTFAARSGTTSGPKTLPMNRSPTRILSTLNLCP